MHRLIGIPLNKDILILFQNKSYPKATRRQYLTTSFSAASLSSILFQSEWH